MEAWSPTGTATVRTSSYGDRRRPPRLAAATDARPRHGPWIVLCSGDPREAQSRSNLGGALRFRAIDTEVSDGGVDASFLAMPPAIGALAFNRRNLRLLSGQTHPLRDVLGAPAPLDRAGAGSRRSARQLFQLERRPGAAAGLVVAQALDVLLGGQLRLVGAARCGARDHDRGRKWRLRFCFRRDLCPF